MPESAVAAAVEYCGVNVARAYSPRYPAKSAATEMWSKPPLPGGAGAAYTSGLSESPAVRRSTQAVLKTTCENLKAQRKGAKVEKQNVRKFHLVTLYVSSLK